MKKAKRLISIILTVMMVLGAVPFTGMTAFAAEAYADRTWDGTKVVKTEKAIPANAQQITSETAHWHACTAEGCDIENYSTCGVDEAAYGEHTWSNGKCTVCGLEEFVIESAFETSGYDFDSFNCASFDSALNQADEIIPTAEEITEPEAPTFMSILMSILNAVVALFNSIIALF